MTKVVNLRREKYDIYIGRPGPFGNKFIIGKDGNRQEVIDKYRIWFYEKINSDHSFAKLVYKTCSNKTLGCYCSPQACHGDIIAEWCDLVVKTNKI
jgi:hypothetical protein